MKSAVGSTVIAMGLLACGEVEDRSGKLPDAAVQADASAEADGAVADASSDAPACEPTMLLKPGSDPTAQGWQLTQTGSVELMVASDFTRLATMQSASGAAVALLSLPAAVDPALPFAIELVMLVETTAGHNQFDAPVALLGSYGGGFASPTERAQMVYFDRDTIGWADDTQSRPASNLDNQFHTYVLAVDAQKTATLSRDGVALLTRPDFITSGTIAIGDQTNDANVDGAMRIRSVRKLCR